MIIVSQEKDAILNFDNVIGIITATDIESKKERLIAIDTIDSERYYIAKYETEERAKEVLQEIINLNIKFELYKTMPAEGKEQAIMLDNFSNNNIKFDTYEMPKE